MITLTGNYDSVMQFLTHDSLKLKLRLYQATDRNPDYEGDYDETNFGDRVIDNNPHYG